MSCGPHLSGPILRCQEIAECESCQVWAMPIAISFSLLYSTNFTNFLLCRLDQAKPVSGPSNVDSKNPILWSFLPCPNSTCSHHSVYSDITLFCYYWGWGVSVYYFIVPVGFWLLTSFFFHSFVQRAKSFFVFLCLPSSQLSS